jgi:hypothetical protein
MCSTSIADVVPGSIILILLPLYKYFHFYTYIVCHHQHVATLYERFELASQTYRAHELREFMAQA